MSLFSLAIDPVNPYQEVKLPEPWQSLSKRIDDDLWIRAKGFKLAAVRLGFGDVADEALSVVGRGFAEEFSPQRFAPKLNDPHQDFKKKFLGALQALSKEFGNRVSGAVWETLAALGTRENPHTETSILSVKDRLTLPWWMADAILHAMGKVFGWKLHVDSRLFAATGMVMEHNCDCNHAARMPLNGAVSCFISPDKFREATAALLSHILSESLLIGGLKMPFEMGVSPEAREAMAM